MAIGPQQVLNEIADGTSSIPGLTEETVNIAGGLISSITDLDLNVYIGDNREIFFGTDLDFTVGASDDQHSLEIKDNIENNIMLQLHDDGTTTFHTTSSDEYTWKGNVALTNENMYIKVEI
tara:strand:+ start:11429 stop:11791 length:363 start_codon:yes stop_codon:yes gene_type:complete